VGHHGLLCAAVIQTPDILRLGAISKSFGKLCVLRDLSLRLPPGSTVLVGPNGVGKSTLLAIIAGVEPPDQGGIEIAGIDLRRHPARAKRLLSYVPDRPCVYRFLTGAEFVDLVLRLKGIRDDTRLQEILERFALKEFQEKRFGEMSLGMQRKHMMACAFVGSPALILMDEPTNGLDASAREVLMDLIRTHTRTGLFLCATHERSFIEALGAQVLLLGDNTLQPATLEVAFGNSFEG